MFFSHLIGLSAVATAIAIAQAPSAPTVKTGTSGASSTSSTQSTCQFALCSNNPGEKAALEKHDFTITERLGVNKLAIQAWDSCQGHRTKPSRTSVMDLYCNFDSVAYSWTADATSCNSKAPCNSFSIMSNWDMAKQKGEKKHEPSQGVWGKVV